MSLHDKSPSMSICRKKGDDDDDDDKKAAAGEQGAVYGPYADSGAVTESRLEGADLSSLSLQALWRSVQNTKCKIQNTKYKIQNTKYKKWKGFMLQVGKKKEKHEFETNDVKAARDWVRALELEVSSLNPLRVHNC